MKVLIARKAGFCMGVRRAVHLALKAAAEAQKPVYTYGPLIHNTQALGLLEALDVYPLNNIPCKGEGTIIIRAHGIPPQEKEQLKKVGFRVIDGTCPRVLKVQGLAKYFSQQGYHIIIIGDPDHAEVKGILGYAGDKGIVISNFKDLSLLPPLKKYVILSQTTQDEEFFHLISQEILKLFPGGEIHNTICNATHERQQEVRRLSKLCEAMVVVGGKNSANTKRLAMIAKEEGRDVFLIEIPEELSLKKLSSYKQVGVTAGASTPNWIINQVVRTLEEIPSPYEWALFRFIRKILRFSFESNLALAGGAFLLTWASIMMLKVKFNFLYPFLSAFFLFAAHTLNRLTDIEVLRLNDPFRACFLEKHRHVLFFLSLGSFLISCLLGFFLGKITFGLIIFLGFSAILYSLPFLWKKETFKTHWPPGSKALFIATAWTTISCFLPWLSSPSKSIPFSLFFFFFCVSFLRAVFLEILEVQGDGFVGREALPVFLGEKKTFLIVKITMALLFGDILSMGIKGYVSIPSIVLLLIVLGYSSFLLKLYERRLLGQALLLEALSEALPILVFLCVGAGYIINR